MPSGSTYRSSMLERTVSAARGCGALAVSPSRTHETPGRCGHPVQASGGIAATLCLPIRDLAGRDLRGCVKKRDIRIGIALASRSSVAEISTPLVYREPTVMWRMCRADGFTAHAIIRVDLAGPMVVWFVNDRPVGCRSFRDATNALRWTDQLRAQNWAAGWRLAAED